MGLRRAPADSPSRSAGRAENAAPPLHSWGAAGARCVRSVPRRQANRVQPVLPVFRLRSAYRAPQLLIVVLIVATVSRTVISGAVGGLTAWRVARLPPARERARGWRVSLLTNPDH